MAIGDADLASGVFFHAFGGPVIFGSQTAQGLFDEPGRDAAFGGEGAVSDTDPQVELGAAALNPFPDVGARLVVNGRAYVVRSASPVDDGATVVLKLRRL